MSLDPSMPSNISFSEIKYISMSFIEALNPNYEKTFVVNTSESESSKVILVSSDGYDVELCFAPGSIVSIKNSTFFYNEHNLVECKEHLGKKLQCSRCPEDHETVWTEKNSFQNLRILECDNGHTRFLLLNEDIFKDWIKQGYIK